jgi:hypothetical protein
MVRRVRIAVSVFFTMLALALCVLWVRSYWRWDGIQVVYSNEITINVLSQCGTLRVQGYPKDAGDHSLHESGSIPTHVTGKFWQWWWSWDSNDRIIDCEFPGWLPGLICLATATATWPYFPVRFSLRTLFLATTLVAVVLGLAVWLAA